MRQYRRGVTLEDLQAGVGREFLFHYTDAIRADAIIEEQWSVSGPRVARGFGVAPGEAMALAAPLAELSRR